MKFLRHWYLILLLAVCSTCAFKKDNDTKRIKDAVNAYVEQEYSNIEFDHIFIENIDTVTLKGYINMMLNLLQEEKTDILTARTAYWQDLLQTKDLSDQRPLFYLVYVSLTNATTQEEVVIPLTLDFKIKTISLMDSLP